MKERVEELNMELGGRTPYGVLEYFIAGYKGKIAQSTSLGAEDQVLTDMICRIDSRTKIFSLDTGRLFQETYDLIEKTNERYNINIDIYFPDWQKVEEMVREKGINLFYRSVENRKRCCYLRKVEPLTRALKGMEVWISAIRKDQTVSRFYSKLVEWDEAHKLIKINPLLEWTEKQVWDYIKENDVPYNILHDTGYRSIGCQPCTRAVKEGEDFRSGRWWWEEPDSRECGVNVIKKPIKHG
jgi:phosphoadenosine phosphosulfate reductase